MNVYVVEYKLKPQYKIAEKSGETVPNEDCLDIFYNEKPLWTFPSKEYAETELRIMLPMGVHMDNHYCKFELEQIGEEKYAIVCNDHPK